MELSKEFTLSRALTVEEVNWQEVAGLLTRFALSPASLVERHVDNFKKRTKSPFSPYWFYHPCLSIHDNNLVASICRVHRTDAVTIYADSSLPFSVKCKRITRFVPGVVEQHSYLTTGACDSVLILLVKGRQVVISGPKQVRYLKTLVATCAMLVSAAVVFAW